MKKFAGKGGGFVVEVNNAAGEHAKEDFLAHGIDRSGTVLSPGAG